MRAVLPCRRAPTGNPPYVNSRRRWDFVASLIARLFTLEYDQAIFMENGGEEEETPRDLYAVQSALAELMFSQAFYHRLRLLVSSASPRSRTHGTVQGTCP